MANTYEYKVTNLQRDENGIINWAAFTITASDGETSNTHLFQTAFANNPVTPIPFEEITEEKVIEWIKRNVGTSSEESADAELEAAKLRKTQIAGLPW